MSRRTLLGILQDRCRALGRRRCASGPRRRTPTSCPAATTSWSPATGSTPRPGPSTPTGSVPPSTRDSAGTCGSAPTRSSTRSPSTSGDTPYGVMQVHAYPYDATGSARSSSRCTTRSGGGPGSTSAGSFAPGESDDDADRGVGDLFADLLDGPPLLANNSRWISFGTVRNESWRARQRRAARRRRAHRALLHRLRHEAGDGGRVGAGRLPARAARRGRGAGGVRGRAAAGGGVHPARGAGQPGVVREPRPVRAPGAGAVRVQPADPQPPGDAGQPAAARPGVRVHGGGRVQRREPGWPRVRRRCSTRTGCAGSSCATG